MKFPEIRPGFAPRVVLRVEGLRRDPGEAAVLEPRHRQAFVATLSWSLELPRSVLELLPPGVRPAVGSVVRAKDAEVWLRMLRPIFLQARGCPRFVLCAITTIDISPTRVRLVGTCAPLLSETREPGSRGDRTHR